MSSNQLKTFTAVLEPDGMRLRWTIARLPFDVAQAWPERRRMRVRGTVDGVAFRCSLFHDAQGAFLPVNTKLQAASGKGRGDRVRIEMEPDLDERSVTMPAELAVQLKQDRALRKWFDGLNESTRKAIGDWIVEPKSDAARQRRAAQMAERLLLTMEGERETPPVLRVAFARHPLAEQGWLAMSAAKRRGHLLGIFYYRDPAARARRAEQAVEEAVKLARRAAGQPCQ